MHSHLDKIFAQDLHPRKSGDCCCFVVPFVHKAVSIDTEDRRVRGIDKGLQLLGYPGFFNFDLLPLSNVLAHSNYSYDVTSNISSCGGIQ
jgi:hypothetical protein